MGDQQAVATLELLRDREDLNNRAVARDVKIIAMSRELNSIKLELEAFKLRAVEAGRTVQFLVEMAGSRAPVVVTMRVDALVNNAVAPGLPPKPIRSGVVMEAAPTTNMTEMARSLEKTEAARSIIEKQCETEKESLKAHEAKMKEFMRQPLANKDFPQAQSPEELAAAATLAANGITDLATFTQKNSDSVGGKVKGSGV